MIKKPIFTKSEITVVLQDYAINGTYKSAGEALKKFIEAKTDQTQNAKKIIEAYRYDSDYAEIFAEKVPEFKDLALLVAEKAVRLADMKLETALTHQSKLNKLLKEISEDEDLSAAKKKEIISFISTARCDKLGEVATTAGVLFDKYRLANDASTDNSTIKVSYEGDGLNEFGN